MRSPNKDRAMLTAKKCRLAVGNEILARWNDGLHYLGHIFKISHHKQQCLVQFEDTSQHYILFKDIYKRSSKHDIHCGICQDNQSEAPNEIVLCDNCGRGYHQLCHAPHINGHVLGPDVEWNCRLCVFTSCVRNGGAMVEGPHAEDFNSMKVSLPYEINKLSWYNSHKTNTEKSYCYCGGPGLWFSKMVQCCRCRQWFHEACIQCLRYPLIHGDLFYIFVCAICNSGDEYIKRLDLNWIDIAHLTLFNLAIRSNTSYFHLNQVILPWILVNWQTLQTGQLSDTSTSETHDQILCAFEACKAKFKSGSEVRKRRALWGLRHRNVPLPPTLILPAEGKITDDVMRDVRVNGRKTKKFVFKDDPSFTVCQKLRRLSSVSEESKKEKRKLLKAIKQTCQKPKSEVSASPNQSYRGYVNGHSPQNKKTELADRRTLDTIIPKPASFDGVNHPFKTVLEQTEETERHQRKMALLSEIYQRSCLVDTEESDSMDVETPPSEQLSYSEESEFSDLSFMSSPCGSITPLSSVCGTASLAFNGTSGSITPLASLCGTSSLAHNGISASIMPSLCGTSSLAFNGTSRSIAPFTCGPPLLTLNVPGEIVSSPPSMCSPPSLTLSVPDLPPPPPPPLVNGSPLRRGRSRKRKFSNESLIIQAANINHSPASTCSSEDINNNRKTSLPRRTVTRVQAPRRSNSDMSLNSSCSRISSSTDSRCSSVVETSTINAISSRPVPIQQLKSSLNSYFGVARRLAQGEPFKIMAKRTTPEGKTQYLVEWKSMVTS